MSFGVQKVKSIVVSAIDVAITSLRQLLATSKAKIKPKLVKTQQFLDRCKQQVGSMTSIQGVTQAAIDVKLKLQSFVTAMKAKGISGIL